MSNATSGGTAVQIKYLMNQGCIPPLCNLLTFHDAKMVSVALEQGLEIALGEHDPQVANKKLLIMEQQMPWLIIC